MMTLTRFERQLLFNQHKILEFLSGDDHDIDYHKMMQEVYHSGFESEYFEYGPYDDEGVLLEEDGKLIYEIINMYDDLYYFWKNTEELKNNVNEYKVMFPGFDLNHPHEHKLYSFAKFLIEDLGKFHDTRELLEKGVIKELNSHGAGPGFEGYKVMLGKFKGLNNNRIKRNIESSFTLEEMNDILNYF